MKPGIVRTCAAFASLAVVFVLAGGVAISSVHATAPTVTSQVAVYYANDGSSFQRSATPMSLPDGGGTVSQTANVDGTVTVALSGVVGYGDTGFGVDAGTLGNLNGLLIQGTGDSFGLNLYFDVDADNEYFTWTGNTFSGLGNDKYILGPSSVSGVRSVNGNTLFTSMNPGGGNYTLAQLKAGAVAGITSTTPVRLWVGTCCSGTQSSTIQSIYISTGTINDFYVDGTYTDGSAGGHIFGVDAFNKIQDAINAAGSGATVHVAAGTYVENITIDKPLTLAGANQATTIIQPALSNPNCGSNTISTSLCSGASNIILVRADNVLIHDFTLDGDNPALTSSQVFGGADIDARNGLITDHTAGTFNGLEVHHVTVRNIFLRGMYASSLGTFNFHDNTVTNVQATPYSIAMFAWGGPGTMQNNTVSYAQDAISANHSKGIQFLNNTVTNSGSGVHTDNAGDGGGTADLIQGNTISSCNTGWGGYGIFVFVPYLAPTVNNNTVTGCQYGLSAFGQGAAVTSSFTNNTVNGPSKAAGSVGVTISTGTFGWGYTDVSVNFKGNSISNNETGVYLDADVQAGNPDPWVAKTVHATFQCNQITGNTNGVAKGTTGTYTNDFTRVWWGAANGPAPTGSGDSVVAGINYSPWAFAPGCPNTTITIAGTPMGSFDIPAAGHVNPIYPGTFAGPVHVVSTDGNIMASERQIYGSSFAEAMGIPGNQLTTDYWFSWYDGVYMQTWISIGAPDTNLTNALVDVYIGTQKMNSSSYSIAPGGQVSPNFPGAFNGPVHVVSTNGQNIFTSERQIYGSSFAESMGVPGNQLTSDYWFSWYDGQYMRSWISIGAPDTNSTDALVDIYIGGTKMNTTSYSIPPGGQMSPIFPGTFAGPVRVVSTNGKNLVVTERQIYGSSFAESTGVPNSQLTTDYWFSWYDGQYMRSWISIGAPGTNTQAASVDIYIGGTKMNTTSYSIAPGGQVSPDFPGTFAGPVHVVSTNGQNLVVTERQIYGSSFAEAMGTPNNQLTKDYWFPWYDGQYMQTWVSIGKP